MVIINIDKSNFGKRVDKFIISVMPVKSKSFFYKMFRKKNIVLNDKKIKGNEILKIGDEIKIYFSDDTFHKLSSKQTDFHYSLPNVVFEDENILVINKAKDVFSQPKDGKVCVLDEIKSHYKKSGFKMPLGTKIGTSNRLDAQTTGIIISGKSAKAIDDINKSIKNHKVKKTYIAIVKGKVTKEIVVNNSIKKKDGIAMVDESGKKSTMTVVPKFFCNDFSYVEVALNTGRYHQIRVTLSHIGYPIIGDVKYGDSNVNRYFNKNYLVTSQMLHSYSYHFLDDICGKYYEPFVAKTPKQFDDILIKMKSGELDGIL